MEATNEIRAFFDTLNHDYLAVHRRKEDLFWATYMGTSDDHGGFATAEKAWKAFVSDPVRLSAVRARLATLEDADGPGGDGVEERAELIRGLRGWRALFEANIVEGDAGPAGMDRIVSLEAELFGKRQKLVLRHRDESGSEVDATLGSLLVNESANPDEAARRSSFTALRGLEEWVLGNGFLDVVRARNAFARSQRARDYFEFKVRKSESMTSEQLFAVLDDFERRTSDANRRGLELIAGANGAEALRPWNVRFRMSGDLVRETDPFFPFDTALDRWVLSFRRLGFQYRGATLQLDLLERKGKYQNGFCHGPAPAFFDRGTWVPGAINFTAEGRPDQVGSGFRALNTLFHEGGHAAHFANVTGNSPCFSQEFPPTSMAYAETQSMFCDSLITDADWLIRYARAADGSPMPASLIRKRIEKSQPFRAFEERLILVVPYFERALYALPDSELTAGRVLALARDTELRILGVESHRPLLAIPHLLNQESAASFHGYLLANMAVYQTRAWFLGEFGFITDNPAVGPLLARHCWAPGNAVTHDETLRALTGEGFSAVYLAEECKRSAQEAWTEAEASMAAARGRSYPTDFPDGLDATIRIVDGDATLADNSVSDEKMCADFAKVVKGRYPRKA
ncbi:MAG: peptidase M3 [Spirochaetae bacterium HGW-Spirochaetae-7]|nr:MAG: peptidase M3 [Spirochaetae bacterium HGW-Spirochaetae-7]